MSPRREVPPIPPRQTEDESTGVQALHLRPVAQVDPGEDDYSSGELIGKTDYLNITGGFNGTINDDWQFGIGAALPLRTGLAQGPTGFEWNSDRTFSWALLANLNYYFR